ncbi:MAG: hypothetical protein ACR2HV_06110 [Acidimicrobiales bacterium]
MRAAISCRVEVAGAELRMLVLAADAGGCLGVDLDSGAFVRARFHGQPETLATFDVATGQIARDGGPIDASRPETVVLDHPPERVGALSARQAERYLEPLHHPRRRSLLGFPGAAVPYWTLNGNQPSLTLVDLVPGPQVHREPQQYECRFTWQSFRYHLPLVDRRLVARLDDLGWPRYSSHDLQSVVGHRVRRLLVALSPPHQGYCYTVVAAILPGP